MLLLFSTKEILSNVTHLVYRNGFNILHTKQQFTLPVLLKENNVVLQHVNNFLFVLITELMRFTDQFLPLVLLYCINAHTIAILSLDKNRWKEGDLFMNTERYCGILSVFLFILKYFNKKEKKPQVFQSPSQSWFLSKFIGL